MHKLLVALGMPEGAGRNLWGTVRGVVLNIQRIKCANADIIWLKMVKCSLGYNIMRCMTWSGQESSAILAGMYTIGVHIRSILQNFPVRYTSYELIYIPNCTS